MWWCTLVKKLGLIWAMLGETIVPKHHNGVNEHDRCTTFLIIFSSSLLLFMDIIDTMIPMVKISKDFDKFLFFYEFLKIWSNYGLTKVCDQCVNFQKVTNGVLWSHCGAESPHDVPFLFVKGILKFYFFSNKKLSILDICSLL